MHTPAPPPHTHIPLTTANFPPVGWATWRSADSIDWSITLHSIHRTNLLLLAICPFHRLGHTRHASYDWAPSKLQTSAAALLSSCHKDCYLAQWAANRCCFCLLSFFFFIGIARQQPPPPHAPIRLRPRPFCKAAESSTRFQ